MNEISISVIILLFCLVIGFFDCFIPVPIPTGVFLSSFFLASDHILLLSILCGMLLSFSSTLSLFFVRKLFKKKREKNSIWVMRLNILYNHLGYYTVFLGAAFLLINCVSYTFLFLNKVNYKKYYFMMLMGRTTVLLGYTYLVRIYIYPFMAFMIVFIYAIVIYKFILNLQKNGNISKDLVHTDQAYSEKYGYDLSKSRFYKFNKKRS